METHYSTRQIAAILGCQIWQVQRIFERGDLAEPGRFAGRRAIPRETLPDVVDALCARGWLQRSKATTA